MVPLVKLIKNMRNDLVFRDQEDLIPGKKWEPQLLSALDSASLIILFWCKHSAESDYVRQEYETAISAGKDVLPIILDDTELPKALNKFQWLHFRPLGFHNLTEQVVVRKMNHRPLSARKLTKFRVMFTLLVGILVSLCFALLRYLFEWTLSTYWIMIISLLVAIIFTPVLNTGSQVSSANSLGPEHKDFGSRYSRWEKVISGNLKNQSTMAEAISALITQKLNKEKF